MVGVWFAGSGLPGPRARGLARCLAHPRNRRRYLRASDCVVFFPHYGGQWYCMQVMVIVHEQILHLCLPLPQLWAFALLCRPSHSAHLRLKITNEQQARCKNGPCDHTSKAQIFWHVIWCSQFVLRSYQKRLQSLMLDKPANRANPFARGVTPPFLRLCLTWIDYHLWLYHANSDLGHKLVPATEIDVKRPVHGLVTAARSER